MLLISELRCQGLKVESSIHDDKQYQFRIQPKGHNKIKSLTTNTSHSGLFFLRATSDEHLTFADHSSYEAQWAGYTGTATIIQPSNNGGGTVVTQDKNDNSTIISDNEIQQLEPIDDATINDDTSDVDKEKLPQMINFSKFTNNTSALMNPELEILRCK